MDLTEDHIALRTVQCPPSPESPLEPELHRLAAKEHGVLVPGEPACQPKSTAQRLSLYPEPAARGEHAFRMVKQLCGFIKIGHCGLSKDTVRLSTMFALANLYMVGRRLLTT